MLLTDTINTQTITTTIAGGNVIVCGVEFRGCSACPAHLADRPAEKPAAKRISECCRRPGSVMRASYSDHHQAWQTRWHDPAQSHKAASGLLLGLAFGLSLS